MIKGSIGVNYNQNLRFGFLEADPLNMVVWNTHSTLNIERIVMRVILISNLNLCTFLIFELLKYTVWVHFWESITFSFSDRNSSIFVFVWKLKFSTICSLVFSSIRCRLATCFMSKSWTQRRFQTWELFCLCICMFFFGPTFDFYLMFFDISELFWGLWCLSIC